MSKVVLITGGAGFIGSHLADELLAHGYTVRALDNLSCQVHGKDRGRPGYLDPRVDLRVGDVCDPAAVRYALDGVDAVVHLAAAVGVGQSMYEVASYTRTNNVGTAVLLEEVVQRRISRLVVASSMSIYGEGLYVDAAGAVHEKAERSLARLKEGQWDPRSPSGATLTPVPTPEHKAPALSSVYALSKFDQEQMSLLLGRAYGIPTVALRFFNVYGPRQALSNPYTGVLAIFAARILNDRAPLVFEDGEQMRDFVNVADVARACRLALEHRAAGVFNVGSGQPRSIREIAERLAAAIGKRHLRPELTGRYRMGDVRHCFADIGHAREVLGYEPQVSFEQGIAELTAWLRNQPAEDRVDEATSELARRGLTI